MTSGKKSSGGTSRSRDRAGGSARSAPKRPAARKAAAKQIVTKKSAAKKSAARKTSSGTARRRSSAKSSRPLWKRLAFWGGVAACWGFVLIFAIIGVIALTLPDVEEIANETRRPSITLVTTDGREVAALGDLYGEVVEVRDLPSHVWQAVLAIEDKRFYDHIGIDFWGVGRALYRNLREGEVVEGGSTITQQLAKNLFLTPERTITRKLQEAFLAVWLELEYSKDEILSLYLNRVYLGAGTYGVDAAARRYYGKSARELGLYESALIAGLLKAPSRLNPNSGAEAAEARAKLVLGRMVEAGFITQRQKGFAIENKAGYVRGTRQSARYFADWVVGEVESRIGRIEDDLTIVTTLDLALQRIAEEELRQALANAPENKRPEQGAVVILSPNGAVRALVGGRSYQESQFNRATQALRQPGSAFKLFVYLAAFERGFTPASEMVDGPISIGGWTPENYDGQYHGRVTLEQAFARSYNTVAAQVLHEVGAGRVLETARRLGITSDLQETPSLALGAYEVTLLELSGAYAVLANQGQAVQPFGILEIRARGGDLLFARQGGGLGQVVSDETLDKIHTLTSAVIGYGTGRAAGFGQQAGGKTGTSQDSRDAWFLGYSAHYAAGVWLGNDDNSPMNGVTGGGLPAQLWGKIMARAHEGLPARRFFTPRSYDTPVAAAQPQNSNDGLLGQLLQGIFSGGGGETPGNRPEGETATDRLKPGAATNNR